MSASTATAASADLPPPDINAVLALQRGDELMELGSIATLMGVDIQGVQKWRSKSLPYIRQNLRVPCNPTVLPEPDIPAGGKPMWRKATIIRWAMLTGRMTPTAEPAVFKPGRHTRPRPVLAVAPGA